MSIRNRTVALTAITEFFRLVTLFRQTFLHEFTRRLHEPAASETVETATVHDAFISACQKCIAQLQTDAASGSDDSFEGSASRAA